MRERDTREDDDEPGEAVSAEVVDGDGATDHEAEVDEAVSVKVVDAEAEESVDATAAASVASPEDAAGSNDFSGDDFGDEFAPTEYLESQVEALRAELSAVQTELETAQRSAAEGADQVLRAKADFENFRKRKERELERLQDERVEKVLLRILPVYDTFGRAIDQYEKDNSEEALYDGLQRIEKMFMQLLESQGITAIEAQGKPFDPNIHEAVCRVEIPEDGFDEMVVDVFETGYIYGEKILKPAKVSVAKE